MTLDKAPLAIDGVLTPSSLLRKGIMTALRGAGGVVDDGLKVSPSTPAGQSLVVAPGLAAVPNGYQSDPDEIYIVSNTGAHAVTSGSMPGSQPGMTYWMVCLVVGDPEYGQTGHPFMPSDFDPAQYNTFQFNRIVVLPCSSSATTFEDLNKTYPGLALARIALPPTTTTVTAGMITDLRKIAGDISERYESVWNTNTTITPAGEIINGLSKTVYVPGPSAVYEVEATIDIESASSIVLFSLLVGGTPQARVLTSNISGRFPFTAKWTVTGLTAGDKAFQVKGQVAGGDNSTAANGSILTIERKR